MSVIDAYDMLDLWYESFKGGKKLSLRDSKELVQDIVECSSLKRKDELQEELLRGTLGVLYKFIKDNGVLMLCDTGYIEFDDLISSLTLAWVEGFNNKILEVGRYSTLFSRDYFESVAKTLGVEDLSSTLKIWRCSYLGALGSYYRDMDNGVELSPYFDSTFSHDCKEDEKIKIVDIIERGYQMYKDYSFVNSQNTALLGLYGMIFTDIVVKNGRYGPSEITDFVDETIMGIDVNDIVLGSPYITTIQRRVLFEQYGFDGNGEKTFTDMGKDYSFGRCRIGQIATKGLKNLRLDKKVLQYKKD